jgi:hypothetical protein
MPLLTVKKNQGESRRQHAQGHTDSASQSNMVKEEYTSDRRHEGGKPSGRHDPSTTELAAHVADKLDEAKGHKLLKEILSAFPASRDWRTAWGISQDLGYSEDIVTQAIEANPHIFEVSPIAPAGIALYRPR